MQDIMIGYENSKENDVIPDFFNPERLLGAVIVGVEIDEEDPLLIGMTLKLTDGNEIEISPSIFEGIDAIQKEATSSNKTDR